MPLVVNLRHLEEHDVMLRGELPVAELDLDTARRNDSRHRSAAA